MAAPHGRRPPDPPPRRAAGPFGGPALDAGGDRFLLPAGACGIPTTARAVAVNVTVTQATAAGHLTLYQAGSTLPPTSLINYRAGQTRANNAVIPLGSAGGVSVHSGQGTGTVHFLLDVTGYLQ